MAAEAQSSGGLGGLMQTFGISQKLSSAGKKVDKFLYGWVGDIEDPMTRRVAELGMGLLTAGVVFGLWIVVMKWMGGAHHYTPHSAFDALRDAIEDPYYWSQLKPAFYITGVAIVGAGIGTSMVFDAFSNKDCDETISKVQRFVVMMLVAGAGFSLFYFPSMNQTWSATLTSNSSLIGLLLMGAAPKIAYEL